MITIDDLTIDVDTLAYSHPAWGNIELNRLGANKLIERANTKGFALDSAPIIQMAQLLGRSKDRTAAWRPQFPKVDKVCCEEPTPRDSFAGEHYETTCANCDELIDED